MSILSSLYIERVLYGAQRWFSSRHYFDGTWLLPEGQSEDTLLSHYALRRKDLPNLLREAWTLGPTRPFEGCITLLERRLDNVVFRLGFAESISEARSLISRGHILVNRYLPKSARLILWPGDIVHFTRKASYPQRPLPSYLQFLNPSTPDRGMMLSLPNLGHSPFPLRKTIPTHIHCRVTAH